MALVAFFYELDLVTKPENGRVTGSGTADRAPKQTPLMPLMPLFLAAQGFWGVALWERKRRSCHSSRKTPLSPAKPTLAGENREY